MKVLNRIKGVLLFFAAPFIALAYIVALPIVGMYYFGKFGYQALKQR